MHITRPPRRVDARIRIPAIARHLAAADEDDVDGRVLFGLADDLLQGFAQPRRGEGVAVQEAGTQRRGGADGTGDAGESGVVGRVGGERGVRGVEEEALAQRRGSEFAGDGGEDGLGFLGRFAEDGDGVGEAGGEVGVPVVAESVVVIVDQRGWGSKRPGSIAGKPLIGEIRVCVVDELDCFHEVGHAARVQRSKGQLLGGDCVCGLSFHRGGDDDAVCTAAAASNGKEEIRVLARVCRNHVAIGEDNGGFQDLIGTKTEIVCCWTMTAALHPASQTSYRLNNEPATVDVYYQASFDLPEYHLPRR